jgi:hypothetical protein
VTETETQRESVQGELDDLLMVFGDVEEKAEKYKVRPNLVEYDFRGTDQTVL